MSKEIFTPEDLIAIQEAQLEELKMELHTVIEDEGEGDMETKLKTVYYLASVMTSQAYNEKIKLEFSTVKYRAERELLKLQKGLSNANNN